MPRSSILPRPVLTGTPLAIIHLCKNEELNSGACQSLKTTVILRPDTLKTTRRITTPRQITMLFQPCPSGGPRLSIKPVLPGNRGRSQGAVGRSGRRGGLTDQVRERRDGLGTGDPQPVTEVAEE